MVPLAREAGPWFSRSFETQELDGSVEVLWTSRFIPDQGLRPREALFPRVKAPPHLALGSSILFLCPWARASSWFLREEAEGR